MEKLMPKRFLLGVLVVTLAFTTMGCIFSGTYTHDGNTATFRGDAGGTATVSGNTLMGISDGTRFSATRANTDSNPFAGTWVGVVEGSPMEVALGNGIWVASGFSTIANGIYTREGGSIRIVESEGASGSATVSGNTLAITFDGMRFALTRANTGSNPFVGAWTGIIDGSRVEIVLGNTIWAVNF